MDKGKLLYAQSGGVTSVINASAAAVIETARRKGVKVLAARNGIIGALREDLIDTSKDSPAAIAALRHTPGGAFGSCRYKLKSIEQNRAQYERLIDVFRAHDIRWFLYNGGNDSAAKYTAGWVQEASLDVESMCESSTRVFVIEVMGRHAGWIAAAAGLAARKAGEPPHVILFPEIPFDEEKFLGFVKATVERVG